MSETIKVRVTSKKGGFIYGSFREKGAVFMLKPVTHSIEEDDDGELKVIPAEKQFSEKWMERVDDVPVSESEQKLPAKMNAPDLKAALTKAGVDIPEGSKKADLVKLLEDHLELSE